MKKTIVVLLIAGLSLLALLLMGTSLLTISRPADGAAINAANRLAAAGNYAEAVQLYEQLLAQDVHDSSLYYNLGNAYYLQGDVGRAILNYERARQLAPRDADIKSNLALARAQAGDPFLATPAGPVGLLSSLTERWLTINEAAVLTLAFWFVAGIAILALWLAGPSQLSGGLRGVTLIALLLVLLLGLSLGARVYVEHTRPEGVVIAPTIALSSEPGEAFETGFNLTGGTTVNILETRNSWARLTAPDDSIEGWIPLDSIERIAGIWSDTSLL